MKKHLSIIVALHAVSLLCLTSDGFAQQPEAPKTSQSASWFHRTFSTLSWADTITSATSPRDLCWQVRRHVSYCKKPEFQWYDGWLTWSRGTGDCKAMAFCVKELCDEKGFVSWIYVIPPQGRHLGHAITMGLWQGKLWMSSNGQYYAVKSEQDALRQCGYLLGREQDTLEFLHLSAAL